MEATSCVACDGTEPSDFVYFAAASRVRPVASVTLDVTSGLGPWPSDHRAVLTTFELPQ